MDPRLQNAVQHEEFEHQHVSNTMESERFKLQNVAIQLKWQLPAPKCCKLLGKRTEQQIQADPKKDPKP